MPAQSVEEAVTVAPSLIQFDEPNVAANAVAPPPMSIKSELPLLKVIVFIFFGLSVTK